MRIKDFQPNRTFQKSPFEEKLASKKPTKVLIFEITRIVCLINLTKPKYTLPPIFSFTVSLVSQYYTFNTKIQCVMTITLPLSFLCPFHGHASKLVTSPTLVLHLLSASISSFFSTLRLNVIPIPLSFAC